MSNVVDGGSFSIRYDRYAHALYITLKEGLPEDSETIDEPDGIPVVIVPKSNSGEVLGVEILLPAKPGDSSLVAREEHE